MGCTTRPFFTVTPNANKLRRVRRPSWNKCNCVMVNVRAPRERNSGFFMANGILKSELMSYNIQLEHLWGFLYRLWPCVRAHGESFQRSVQHVTGLCHYTQIFLFATRKKLMPDVLCRKVLSVSQKGGRVCK